MSKLEVILIFNLIELLKSLMYWQGEVWQDLDFSNTFCTNKTIDMF